MKDLPKFIVVVHVKGVDQAIEQSKLALDNGAGGVFLINHLSNWKHLLTCYEGVRKELPDAWIGLNFLDLVAEGAILNLPEGADGLWVDNPYIQSVSYLKENGQRRCSEISKVAKLAGENETWIMFASVAFKYQIHEPYPYVAATVCSSLFNVTVTSGYGTGISADIKKIKLMKQGVGERPLALASGVTATNVLDYLPYVDCFMVATGVSNEFDNLVPEKVKELAEIIYGYKN